MGRRRGAGQAAHGQRLDPFVVEQPDRRVEYRFAVDRGRTAPGRSVGSASLDSASAAGGRPRSGRCLATVVANASRMISTASIYMGTLKRHGTRNPDTRDRQDLLPGDPGPDIERSSRFYGDAFGWQLRDRGDGAVAFDDTVTEVSGTWVTGRPPSAEPGIMVHIMVAELEQALAAVRAAGGEVLDGDAVPGEHVAHVRDPAGNVIGIYQQPGLAERERTPSPVPEHLHTVTPRLALSDGAAGIDFYKAAFDAREPGERHHMPDGTLVHAELLIGDSVVMVTDAQDDEFKALLATYWPDVDAAWDRAVRAGAEVIHPLADQFYGERGGLADPFGNEWMLAARIENLTAAEMAARMPQ